VKLPAGACRTQDLEHPWDFSFLGDLVGLSAELEMAAISPSF
jgi:hypothetical protein